MGSQKISSSVMTPRRPDDRRLTGNLMTGTGIRIRQSCGWSGAAETGQVASIAALADNLLPEFARFVPVAVQIRIDMRGQYALLPRVNLKSRFGMACVLWYTVFNVLNSAGLVNSADGSNLSYAFR